jgi:hypothetical protein
MHKSILTLILIGVALFTNCPFAMARDVGFNVLMNNGNGKIMDDGDIFIHSDAGGTARITAGGALSINGDAISVTQTQKAQLARYVATVKGIEFKGVQLGKDAAGFAANMVADALAGVFTGEDEDKIDRKAEDRAHDFKQKVLPICKDVQDLKEIQDILVASIQTFRPYAVIKTTDIHDCEHDIDSDD